MTLSEMLATLPRGKYIRIGCTKGSGFLCAGRVAEIDLRDIDRRIKADISRTASESVKESCRQNARDRLKAYIPLERRPVIDCYPTTRTGADAQIIIIEGTEAEREKDGIRYFADNFEIAQSDQDAVLTLAAEITIRIAGDLQIKYRDYEAALQDMMKQRQEFERLREKMYQCFETMQVIEKAAKKHGTKINHLERRMRDFCIKEDPDAVIEAIKKQVYGG